MALARYRRLPLDAPLPGLPARFGLRSPRQVASDLATVLRHMPTGERFASDWRSAGLLRPDLSLPAYAGLLPKDGIAPIFNFFDRVGGGSNYRFNVRRKNVRDYRGGRLSYEEHDGTDFVCPPGTPLVAAAPGIVVATRDTWLRGGLTLCIDHGEGVLTQYTHLTSTVAEPGQRVERGEIVARAGTSGYDMTQFFPWVPPHVHFMVWVNGQPVDPYLADGEAPRPGTWLHGNAPRTSVPIADDPSPSSIDVAIDRQALDRVIASCTETSVREELDRAPDDAARLAIVEDSLHHERHAWPTRPTIVLRPPTTRPERVKLTLPLPRDLYEGARAADAPWTRAS